MRGEMHGESRTGPVPVPVFHWAARNARLTGSECPIQEGFIAERRKPLDWVIGVSDEWDEWDEIPMDT